MPVKAATAKPKTAEAKPSEIKVTLTISTEHDEPGNRYISTVKGAGTDRKIVSGVKRGIGIDEKSAVLNLIATGGLVSPANAVVRSAIAKGK